MKPLNLIWALPTWLLAALAGLFVPQHHPWFGKRFKISDWAKNRTALCKQFDIALWVCVPCVLIALRVVLR